jgi:hypothetical protein
LVHDFLKHLLYQSYLIMTDTFWCH